MLTLVDMGAADEIALNIPPEGCFLHEVFVKDLN